MQLDHRAPPTVSRNRRQFRSDNPESEYGKLVTGPILRILAVMSTMNRD
jgi:hypothetical protein